MKTEQQKRFETAIEAAGHYVSLQYPDGTYISVHCQKMWESWQLGEASGLALAAAECEKKANKHAIRYEKYGAGTDTLASDTCGECAEAIRALMTEGVKP